MCVGKGRENLVEDANSAGHAEVGDERFALTAFDGQLFSTAVEGFDAISDEEGRHCRAGEGIAGENEVGSVDLYGEDASLIEGRGETAAKLFNFWKFGHGAGLDRLRV